MLNMPLKRTQLVWSWLSDASHRSLLTSGLMMMKIGHKQGRKKKKKRNISSKQTLVLFEYYVVQWEDLQVK